VRVVLENIGPIKKADISAGDLTVLVGPQAAGKSIFLQLFKFCVDHADIVRELKKLGFDWKNELESFLPVYFGEGMQAIWNSQSCIGLNGRKFQIETHVKRSGGNDKGPKVFYIPAQRVLIISAGWPLPFTSFDPTYPFVVKDFSEKIRRIMDSGLGRGDIPIFPRDGYFKKEIRDALQKSIMREGKLKLDIGLRKRIMLEVAGVSMPIMTWSAGQREFAPLLLGLFWLLPSAKVSKKQGVNWVIVEEPEAGLHPLAIRDVFLTIVELLSRNYRVLLSTHSSGIIELVWAINEIVSHPEASTDKKRKLLLDLFELKTTTNTNKLMKDFENKKLIVNYFKPTEAGVVTEDISSLDPGSDKKSVSEWGGLVEFTSKTNEIVAKLWR